MSDNKLVEGIATLGLGGEGEETASRMGDHVIKTFAGVSKKGYAPYNPRKRNQDSILMEEHKATGTLIFGVFDGHGEAGDLVSHYFTERIPSRLAANPRFASDTGAAMAEDLDRLEKQLLAGEDGGKEGVEKGGVGSGERGPPNSGLPPITPPRSRAHNTPFASPSFPPAVQTRASTRSSAAAPA